MNLRPSGYEPDELPGCSIPRQQKWFKLQVLASQPLVVTKLLQSPIFFAVPRYYIIFPELFLTLDTGGVMRDCSKAVVSSGLFSGCIFYLGSNKQI